MANLAASGVWADGGAELARAGRGDRAAGASAATGGARMRGSALCPWHQVLLLEGGQAASLLGPLAAEQAGRLARRGEPFRAGNCLAHRTLGSRGGPEGGRCASAGTAGSRRLAPRSRLPANADAHLSLEKAMTLDPRIRNPLQ